MLARASCQALSLVIFLDMLARPCYSESIMNKASKAAQLLSKLGASKGGKARASKLSPERRKAIAQKAAKARWSEKDKN
jgi:hypothetical protein